MAAASKITWENTLAYSLAFSSGLEALFYRSLVGKPQTNPLKEWARRTCIARIDAVQSIFNAINAATIIYYTARVFCALQEKCQITHVLFNSSLPNLILKSLPATLGTGGLIALSIAIWTKSHPTPVRETTVTKNEQGESFLELRTFEYPSSLQQFGRLYHVTKIVFNIALICLTASPLVCAITLATSGYSLLKNMNIKWRYFLREMNTSQMPIPTMTAVLVTYRFLVLPRATSAPATPAISAPTTPEDCSICLENIENNIQRKPFCQEHHIIHLSCITDYIISKFNTSIFQRPTFTKSGNRYSATIPQEDLPTCPNCRDVPSLDIMVKEGNNTYNASVKITGRPSLSSPPISKQALFANLHAAYNIVQAGLSYLQKYPEFAATVFKIQQVMMITDIIGYAYTTHTLYKRIEAKLKMENSVVFKVAALTTLVAVAALSYYVTLQINTYLQSTIVLKDLLAKLPIAPETLKNIEIGWHSPLSQRLIQSLYINRIVSTVALAFFSTEHKAHLLSAAAQISSLVGISRLRWIELSQLLNCNFEVVHSFLG